MSSPSAKYRSRKIASHVIAFSMSYQPENLLARGLGLQHLKELLVGLARPLLRQGASLAYGGYWKDTPDNLTDVLLRLINAEQEDNSLQDSDSSLKIGLLYNHAAWPNYLSVTPAIEAQWINCCRIIRITQEDAGFEGDEIVPDALAGDGSDRTLFNTAVTLSTMRRRMSERITVQLPDLFHTETFPPVTARILLGGKLDGFAGFIPGIFEEAYCSLAEGQPLYILGGFGGAAEVLANALLDPAGAAVPAALTLAHHEAATPAVATLVDLATQYRLPCGPAPAEAYRLLGEKIGAARGQLATSLNTGLTEEETRLLLRTQDINVASRLVREGLAKRNKLFRLAS